MIEFKLTNNRKDGWQLNNKPIGHNDVLLLLAHISDRDNDKDLELVIDYWIMLKESGHNGFYLKDYHKVTQNKDERII